MKLKIAVKLKPSSKIIKTVVYKNKLKYFSDWNR